MSQTRTNLNNFSDFAGAGGVVISEGNTILQDADHTGDVLEYTVIARTAAGALKNMEASDGSEYPVALLRGVIPNADITAGNVSNVQLYTAGKYFKEASIVLENSLTLDTAVVWHGTAATTIREALQDQGIFIRPVDAATGYENS